MWLSLGWRDEFYNLQCVTSNQNCNTEWDYLGGRQIHKRKVLRTEPESVRGDKEDKIRRTY